jgi:hypothetical protein
MRSLILPLTGICLLFGSLTLMADDTGAASTKPVTGSASSQSSSVSVSAPQPAHQLSRKCGIFSGVCRMVRPAEVGAYCLCNTPSGAMHGVVIP